MLLYVHDMKGHPIYDILSICDSIEKCHELISYHSKYHQVEKYHKVINYNQVLINPAYEGMNKNNHYTLLSSRSLLSKLKYNAGTEYVIEIITLNQLIL